MCETPALVLKNGSPTLCIRPAPRLERPDHVLVRVAATGICGTDRAILLGEFPAREGVVLGHEAAGEVIDVGPAVTTFRAGDRVVINPAYHCGRCVPCRRGTAAYCTAKEGRELGVDGDGTMAGVIVVAEHSLHSLPPGVSFRRAAMVEPLACVLTNVRAAAPRWDDRVVVAGAGPIGTLCALVLAYQGARVTLLERDAVRTRLAREMLPSSVRVLNTAGNGLGLPEGLLAAGPDVVIDTTGVLLEEAFAAVADSGTVVMMGEREHARGTIPLRALTTRGVRVIGAGPYPPDLFEVALDLANDLPLDRLVTDEFPLVRFRDAFGALGVPTEAGAAPTEYTAMKVYLVSSPELVHPPAARR